MIAALLLAATLDVRIVEAPPLRHAPPTRTTKLDLVQALYELPERDSMLLLREGALVELSMITGNETVLGRDLGATAVESTIAFDRELLVVLQRGHAPLLFDARRNRTYTLPVGTDADEFIAAPGGRYALLQTHTADQKPRLYRIHTQSFAVQALAEGGGSMDSCMAGSGSCCGTTTVTSRTSSTRRLEKPCPSRSRPHHLLETKARSRSRYQ